MASGLENLKIAIVADWLTDRGGAERVVLTLVSLFPRADIFTSVFKKENFPELRGRRVITSFLQRWPLKFRHQLYLLLRPLAFEEFDLKAYDIVISSSSAESKGIITLPETFHLCYCHTPTRYFWSHYKEYLGRPQLGFLNPLARFLMPLLIPRLRRWDFLAAQRVDQFVANSQTTQERIKKYYQRESKVIYPPVESRRFEIGERGDYFIILGRQIPYKRTDIAIEAFNRLGLPLKVVGQGPELRRLMPQARKNIQFIVGASDQKVAELLRDAQALIFPQEEDFGIVALEAQASGKPVIAYRAGGALESVIPGKTGVFFGEQTPESLILGIKKFARLSFKPALIRQHAVSFDTSIFKRKFAKFLKESYIKYRTGMGLVPKI